MRKILIASIALMLLAVAAMPANAQSGHAVDLTWTAPAVIPTGAYINIYRGTATGAEATTPINPTGINPASLAYTDSNVLANTKYFYIARECDVDLATSKEVCSSPSNEASATVPLGSADLTAPGSLGAVGK